MTPLALTPAAQWTTMVVSLSPGRISVNSSGFSLRSPLGIWIAPSIKPLLSISLSFLTSIIVAPSSYKSLNLALSIALSIWGSPKSASVASVPKRGNSLASQAGIPPANTLTSLKPSLASNLATVWLWPQKNPPQYVIISISLLAGI